MSAAPQMLRFLTTLALISTASLAATNNAQEVNLRGASVGESKWQTKELKALMKSDAAKLKNQIKLERMFALASGSASTSEKNTDKLDNNKDKKKNKSDRLRAETEGGSSSSTSSSTSSSSSPRSQQPKQDKEESVLTMVEDLGGFDLAPESISRGSAMMRTTMSPVDGSVAEMQPPYAHATRTSTNSGYHLYEAGLQPINEAGNEQVEVSNRYPQSHNEYLSSLSAPSHSGRGSGSHIRVVFNNNPQFIIGRTGHDGLPVPVHSSVGHSRLQADDYNPAESSVDETKVALNGGPKNDHQLPCSKDRASHHVGHMEMINLRNPSIGLDEQKNVPVPELHTVRQPMSLPPPLPNVKASSPVIATNKPLDLLSALSRPSRPNSDDEQVNVPLEEVSKSNFRPPLRMVISMRNKDGDFMKLPINLQGSKGSSSFIDLGPKMRIHFEPQAPITHLNSLGASFTGGPLDKLTFVDENTPIDGDVFDPANIKPFAKLRARSRDESTRVQEKVTDEKPMLVLDAKVKTEPVELAAKMPVLSQPPQPADLKPLPEPLPLMMQPVPQTKLEPLAQVRDPFPVQQSEEKKRDCDKSDGPLDAPIFMPPTNLFQNKTLANMFVEFQRALTEQMQIQNQFPISSSSGQVHQQASFPIRMRPDEFRAGPVSLSPQETDMRALRAMQLHEQQEDLVVAMMAANASNPASIEPGKQMSMTVITPPRGTSLEEAIRMHVGDTEDRTVAILHSSSGSGGGSGGGGGGGSGDGGSPAGAVFQSVADSGRGALSPVEEHSRPFPVDVQLRKPGSSIQQSNDGPQSGPVAVPQDSDGFASATNLNHHHQRRWPYELERQYYHYNHQHQRYKRSAASEFADSLEPSDRLAAVVGRRQRRFMAPVNETAHDNSREDPVVGAASEEHHNEAESDVDSAGDSSEEEPSSTGSDSDMEARSDVDLDGDSSESELDDSPDESSEFDSDDEPYNQVASSERDYNTPAFEIPQIDLSSDSLKQKGCRTVLREVQEIPLNGLEATRADGTPGSGFVSGRPVELSSAASTKHQDGKLMIPKASTISTANTNSTTIGPTHYNHQQLVRTKRRASDLESRANLINSRKVTSIVMTKECLFPDGDTQESPSSSQQAANSPLVNLAPNLQVNSLGIGKPAGRQADAIVGPSVDWSSRGSSPGRGESSTLRRRSVQAPSERDFYVVSDSRRNEVAHKMYKPPSDSNPYHSLVYRSKNGADPDTEPDEPNDDSFASSETPSSSQRGIKLTRHGSSPRQLSARERAALQDSEHDDTDPAPDISDKDETPSTTREASEEEPEGSEMRSSNEAQKLQVPEPRSFGKSLKIDHSVGRQRPQHNSLSNQLRALKPGMQGYMAHTTTDHRGNKLSPEDKQQVVSIAAERRDASASNQSDAPVEDEDDGDDDPATQGTAQERKSQEARADEEDSEPDVDPEYNPKESRLKSNGKPKKTHKSFAYVHRNPVKKGAKKSPDDDFVVSYGRGNVQTEHEDYDSERDSGPPPASLRNRRTLASRGSEMNGYPQFGLRVASGSLRHLSQPRLVPDNTR